MNAKTYIIINADDFGLSSAVNEAVHDAAERGVLSSATIMANMPAFDEAVRIAKDVPRLGVGVHLNLLRGRPVCDPAAITSIVDRRGNFLSSAASLAGKMITGRIKPAHIEMELNAQIRRAIENGITPTHIDSEKHLHLAIPGLWGAVCSAAVKNNIGRIRIIRERLNMIAPPPRPSASQFVKTLFINMRAAKCARFAMSLNLKFTNSFFGLALTGKMTVDVYEKLFINLPDGTMEIMCHPAISVNASSVLGKTSWLDRYRVKEYLALIDQRTKDALGVSGAHLGNYGGIK